MEPVPVKPPISPDERARIDIRTSAVRSAAALVRSRGLMQLVVDFGAFRRTMLVGMKRCCSTSPERPVPDGARAG